MTCGGLCPGINTVIREIVCGLKNMYGVDDVIGIQVSITETHLLGFYSSIQWFLFWSFLSKEKRKKTKIKIE